jgi:L-ribulokinase
MSSGFDAVYEPREAQSRIYETLYQKYLLSGEFIESRFLQKSRPVTADSI